MIDADGTPRRIVMFVYGDVTHDSRVLREAAALGAAGHVVTVMARPADPAAIVGDREMRAGFALVRVPVPGRWRRPWRIVGLPVRLVARVADRLIGRAVASETLTWAILWRFAVLGWTRAAAAAAPAADVHHGHDLPGLAAAIAARRRHGGQVIYDSHEIFLESGANVRRPAWIVRRLARIEQDWIDESVAVVTVNHALADELGRRYRLPRVAVVHNCPPRWEPASPPDRRLRSALGASDGASIAIYHGSFSPHRGLDQLAQALLEPGLERISGAFLGYGSQRDRLVRLAAEPRFGGRLSVLDPVPPEEVVPWLSGADVAVMALQRSSLNHVLSTPNKLFEALAAGVPIVASDFPAIRAIVIDDVDGPLGELCDPADPASIAGAIRRVVERTPDEMADLRRRCLAAAHARWNWETEAATLVALYGSLPSPDR